MQIPENLSEQEVVDVILKVCKKLAPKYVFASYEVEDIEQEAFMMGVEALNRYDSDKPLENFIYAHINNRLKNFKRDNYYRFDYGTAQKIQDRKKSILEPVDIAALYSLSTDDNIVDEAHLSEVLDLIDRKLPADLRGDYLKLRTNSPLPKGRKAIIIQTIENIINGECDEEG
tara:strand:+ start:99 stop:617 length:519 start_codon:yes stop_codon:yes gene_type:complete